MRASCECGHERAVMELNVMDDSFTCRALVKDSPVHAGRVCGATVRAQSIAAAAGVYGEMDGLAQRLADFELEGIVDASGELRIEFPRRA